jgi:type I restriction enzyme S subunit
MSLKFKFIPLTFQKDDDEIKKQIRNTIILRHLFEQSNKTVPLKSLIESTQYGYNASALLSGKNKFLRISDITDGKVDWETVPFCDCDSEDTYLLYKNDLLIARTGGTTGKSFLIIDPPAHSIYAGYLIRIRANKDADPLFLNLFLNSYVYWSQIVSLNEGEFRPSANATTLQNLILPFCTLQQQRDAIKISNSENVKGYEVLISEIKMAISNYEKCKTVSIESLIQLNLVEPLIQSIIQDGIQGKLTATWRTENPKNETASIFLKRIKAERENLVKEKKIKKEKFLLAIPKDEIPFELPTGWVWTYISEIAQIFTGDSINKDVKNSKYTTVQEGLNYIGTKDVEFGMHGINYDTGVIIPAKEINNPFKIAPINSILLCIEGGSSGKKIGLTTQDVCFGNKLLATVPHDLKLSKYLFFLYNSTHFKNEFKNLQSKGLRGGVSINSFKTIKIPLPPIDELMIIVKILEVKLSKCSQLSKAIITSDTYADQLMQATLKEAFETKTAICQE